MAGVGGALGTAVGAILEAVTLEAALPKAS